MIETGEEVVEAAKVGEDGAESKGEYPNLAWILCIRYSITFRRKSVSVLALFDLGSEVNTIHLTLVRKPGLLIRPINIGAQKIDDTKLDIFGTVVTAFSMTDKANRVKFFKETFLVANVSLEVVLGMFFLTLNGANVDFWGRKLW